MLFTLKIIIRATTEMPYSLLLVKIKKWRISEFNFENILMNLVQVLKSMS